MVVGNPAIAGSSDGPALSALFSRPAGLALDAAGNIYVADSGNNAIRGAWSRVEVTTLAGVDVSASWDGSGVAGEVQQLTRAVAIDGASNVYVLDAGNSAIREVTAEGLTTTVLQGTCFWTFANDLAVAAGQTYLPTVDAVVGLAANGHLERLMFRQWPCSSLSATPIFPPTISSSLSSPDPTLFVQVTPTKYISPSATTAAAASPLAIDGAGNIYIVTGDPNVAGGHPLVGN